MPKNSWNIFMKVSWTSGKKITCKYRGGQGGPRPQGIILTICLTTPLAGHGHGLFYYHAPPGRSQPRAQVDTAFNSKSLSINQTNLLFFFTTWFSKILPQHWFSLLRSRKVPDNLWWGFPEGRLLVGRLFKIPPPFYPKCRPSNLGSSSIRFTSLFLIMTFVFQNQEVFFYFCPELSPPFGHVSFEIRVIVRFSFGLHVYLKRALKSALFCFSDFFLQNHGGLIIFRRLLRFSFLPIKFTFPIF